MRADSDACAVDLKVCYVIRPTDKVVRAANGTKLELAGESKVVICIDNDCMQVIALISHDIDEVMLGYDYLTDNRCVWDFGNNQIFIRGKPYTPFVRHGPPKCRRVFVTTNIVVPAKTTDRPTCSFHNKLL